CSLLSAAASPTYIYSPSLHHALPISALTQSVLEFLTTPFIRCSTDPPTPAEYPVLYVLDPEARPLTPVSSSTHAATWKGAQFLMPDAATICLQNPQENDDSLSHRQQESSPPPTALLAPTSRQQAGVPLTSRSQNPYHASTSTFY